MPEPLHILLVEDNEDDGRLMVFELRKAGYDLEWTRVETEEGFVAGLAERPDLILADYRLPAFDGLRALSILRERDPDLPFILISGTLGEEAAVEAIKLGATDYVIKDRIARLPHAVRRALVEKRLRSEQKRVEEKLRLQSRALETAANAVVISSPAGDVLWVNPAFTRISGYPPDEAIGRNLRFLKSGKHKEPFYREMWNTLLAARTWTGEFTNRRKDGSHYQGEQTISPVCDANGRITHFVGIMNDVTERRRAEGELQRAHSQIRHLLAHSPAVIYVRQLNGSQVTPVVVSENIERLLGVSVAEASSHEWWLGSLHPEDRERVLDALTKAINADGYSIEYRLRHRDGAYRWVEDSNRVIRDAAGQPTEAVGVFTDITARRRAEIALRESEELFRQLAENINEVFWMTDPTKNQMLYISPAYEKIWGRPRETLYSSPRNWLIAIHPEDRDRVVRAAETKQAQGRYDEVYRIIQPDGSSRWIHDRAFPVRDAAGEVYRIVGTAEDITERRRTEDKLREQATLLDKAQDAILVEDLEHRLLFWNKSAERLYGWSTSEVIGLNLVDQIYRHSGDYLAAIKKVMEDGEWMGQLQQVTREKKPVVVEGRWTLVRDDTGNPRSILAINTDITERKKLEAQFLRAQRMESIGTLAGGIAHDLNNVLAPILVSLELLGEEIRSADGQATLETMRTCAQRGADLVKQVLTFARGVEGDRIDVNVSHLLREVRKLLRETFPKNLQVTLNIPRNLWCVVGDPTQLNQVFMNLSVNARDAMPEGGRLEIKAENIVLDDAYAALHPDAKPGSYILLTFSDTGMGITPEIRERIFEPFFTTKEIGKGTGLGLSTVMAVVRSHGGFIRVYSEPGEGTNFSLYFPAVTQARAADENTTSFLRPPTGNGECVLIVDDEAGVRELTKKSLERNGYRVLTAANGVEALAIYEHRREGIAVVLVDMMMPVMDGPATVRALRAINPSVRIICSSGLASSEGIASTMGARIQHFISKPYSARTLLSALAAVLAD